MPLIGRTLRKRLLWLWAICTLTPLLLVWDWPSFYGYTPLFAVPFLFCLMPLWRQTRWRTFLWMLGTCYAAQWGFMWAGSEHAWAREHAVWIILVGLVSAVATGTVSTTIGQQHSLKIEGFLLLGLCGGCAMVPSAIVGSFDFDLESLASLTLSVWLWQLSVGTILIIRAGPTLFKDVRPKMRWPKGF